MAEVTTTKRDIVGLALPALRSQGGYFASKGPYDTAWGDVLLALFTPIGSRPGVRSFGSALHLVLYEPDVDQQGAVVQEIAQDTVKTWCPHVVLRDFRFRTENKAVNVWIAISLVGDTHIDRRLVELDRRGVVKAIAVSQGV